jgi:triosephosphate isomerase (TIM)
MSKLIIGNWKSHKTQAEAQQWVETLSSQPITEKVQVVIAPPFPFLPVLHWQLQNTAHVSLGTQTISPFPAGSYTGAVSGRNLLELGVTHAIVGHSDRRRYFGETSQDVAKQVDQCLQNNIVPVVCVDLDYVAEQASAIANDQLTKCVVAYEPLEAIGTGNNVSVEEVEKAKQRIQTAFGKVEVLYGGSVNSGNVSQYLPIVDGFIVGKASLDVTEFAELVRLV